MLQALLLLLLLLLLLIESQRKRALRALLQRHVMDVEQSGRGHGTRIHAGAAHQRRAFAQSGAAIEQTHGAAARVDIQRRVDIRNVVGVVIVIVSPNGGTQRRRIQRLRQSLRSWVMMLLLLLMMFGVIERVLSCNFG